MESTSFPNKVLSFFGFNLRLYLHPLHFVNELISLCKKRDKGWICYLNADTFNRACSDPDFHEILDQAKILYADGMSILYGARLFLKADAGVRVTAADFLEEFFFICEKEQIRIFFLGGSAQTCQFFQQTLGQRHPALEIDIQHGYFPSEESSRVLDRINAFRPDLLIVGMGSPRQEKWVRDHQSNLPCLAWHVGAVAEFYTGTRYRAPIWARKNGMEWLFRLIQEPGRLWRRYLIGNWKFLWNLIRLSGDNR